MVVQPPQDSKELQMSKIAIWAVLFRGSLQTE
jgi:hypothetical protein